MNAWFNNSGLLVMIRNTVTTELKTFMVYNSSCHFIFIPEVTAKIIKLGHLLGFSPPPPKSKWLQFRAHAKAACQVPN